MDRKIRQLIDRACLGRAGGSFEFLTINVKYETAAQRPVKEMSLIVWMSAKIR
jgi:hypothetical protein